MFRTIGFAVPAIALLAVQVAWAQQPAPTRIRGQIEKAEGGTLAVKARDGQTLQVKLADNVRVLAYEKASLADVKPNAFIGVTAMPQPDGSQKAIAIHIFLESQRGVVSDGHRPWDLRPGSTMTNATVDTTVTGVDGRVITVKYKDGEKKVLVDSETPIVSTAVADKSELKPGAQIIIMAAQKQPDGSFVAPSISVGRGVTPPM